MLADIQSLNEWALEGKLEVTALSLHAYPFVQDRYILLPHGASMGSGYGPVVVAREKMTQEDLAEVEIAVPGRMTTAFLLLRLLLGDYRYREVPFDQIIDEVQSGKAEAGLLIHEGQLTYESLGLHKVVDLGEWWLLETGLPLPLGVNAARRDLGEDVLQRLSGGARGVDPRRARQPRRGPRLRAAVGPRASEELTDRFVGMYVNELTCDYGEEGREAVRELLRRGEESARSTAGPRRVRLIAPGYPYRMLLLLAFLVALAPGSRLDARCRPRRGR